jgi:hypothetical protein
MTISRSPPGFCYPDRPVTPRFEVEKIVFQQGTRRACNVEVDLTREPVSRYFDPAV